MAERTVQLIISAQDNTQAAFRGIETNLKTLDARARTAGESFRGLGAKLVAAFAAFQLGSIVKEVALLAARYETLGVSMYVVGAKVGYSTQQMDAFQKSLQNTGIAMLEARQSLLRMASAQIDLTKADELARIAQGAAVIANIGSSEAFEKLILGIQSAQVETLRNIGINVSFEQSYKKLADQIGKNQNALEEHEKLQARTNVVLEKGKLTMEVYEAAMSTAGKQLGSLQRYMSNLKVVAGGVFSDILLVGVQTFTVGLQEANDEMGRLAQENQLKEWSRDIVRIFAVVADVVQGIILVLKLLGRTLSLSGGELIAWGNVLYYALRFDFSMAEKWVAHAAKIKSDYIEGIKSDFANLKSAQEEAKKWFAEKDSPAGQAKQEAFYEKLREEALAAAKEKEKAEKATAAAAAAKKLGEEFLKLKSKLETDIAKSGLDEFESQLYDIRAELAEMVRKFGDKPIFREWFRLEAGKAETAKARAAAEAQIELQKNITDVYLSEIEKRDAAVEDWTEKQMQLAVRAAATEAELEQKLTEIVSAQRHQREQNRMKDAEQERQDYLDTVESYISAYTEATNISREFGETESEYAKRTLSLRLQNIEVLKEFADEMKAAGLEEEKAYKIIAGLIEETAEEQRKLNATFEDGIDYGLREYSEELQDTYKKGRDIAMSTAISIENALVEMFDNPKKAMDDLFKYFVNLLKRMAVQALAQPIIIPVSTMMTGAAGAAGTVAGGGGLLGTGLGIGGASLGGLGLAGLLGLGTGGIGGGAGAIGGYLGGSALAVSLTHAIAGAIPALPTAMIGAVFSAIPILGTVLGGLLGGLLGKLFGGKKKYPEMFLEFQAGKDASGYGVGKGWTGGAMGVEGGLVGFGYKNVGDWTKTEQQLLELFGNVRAETMKELEALGIDISGFFQDWKKWFPDLTGKTAEEIQAMLKEALGEYVSFASGIDFSQWQKSGEDLIDTVNRVLTAFKAFPKVLESIDDYISAVNDQTDEVAKWKDSLREASEKIEEMWKELEKLEDPSDVLNAVNQLKQATYDYYMSQIQLVQQMSATIKQLEVEMATFQISMQQKIGGLTGNLSASIGAIWQHGLNMYQNFQEAGSAAEKLTWLQQIISALDQWVAANIAAIQAKYQAMQDAISSQIEALNKQKEAINEQLEGLREQLRITQMWKNVVEQIKKQILDMMISAQSPRDVFERMAYARDEIGRLQGLYAGASGEERAGYATELAQAIQAYMGLAAEAFQRPSPEYQAIYDEMIRLLDSIRIDAEGRMESEIDLLRQIRELETQSKAIDEQIKGLQEQANELSRQMQAEIEAFKQSSVHYYEWAMTEGTRLYQEKLDMLKEKLGEILGELTLQEYIALKQKEATDALQSLKSWADSYWTNLQSVLAGGQAAQPNSPTPAPISPAPSETCPICNTPGGQHQAWCPYAQSWFGASGGIVTRATRAVIGEAGAEAVIPLSKLKDYTTNVSISPTINITATGNISPVTLAKTIEQVIINSIKYGKSRKVIQEMS